MIRRLLSLILLSTLSLTEGNEGPFQTSITVTKLGDNVTLTCSIPRDDVGLSYWYKLNFGYMIETIASGSFDKISHTKTQQKSFTVKQTSDVESVHLGDTMTLQCSLLSENKDDTDQCPGEDKVHWFKGASESHPGIIYHGSIKNKEEGRCDYSLSKTITNSSDAGTYYCAVVTCGEILFGKGTKVEIEEFPLIAVLGALLTCSVLMNFALILTRKKIQPREHREGKVEVFTDVEQDKSSRDQMSNEEGEEVGLNYVALDFPSRKSSRWKSKKESPESTIYSGIREGQ